MRAPPPRVVDGFVVMGAPVVGGRSGTPSGELAPVGVLRQLAAHDLAVRVSAMAVVMGPGHGTARSSTEFTEPTSAAVPQTKISSAM